MSSFKLFSLFVSPNTQHLECDNSMLDADALDRTNETIFSPPDSNEFHPQMPLNKSTRTSAFSTISQ
jgi:hypothetical protein